MTAMNKSEFEEYVLSLKSEGETPFEPYAHHDPDGDCVEFFVKNDDFFAERVDDLLTVYYSRDSRQIVGSLIKGVSRFCSQLGEKMPGLAIRVKDGPVRLEHLFLAGMWAREHDEVASLTYEKLVQIADESGAEATLNSDC